MEQSSSPEQPTVPRGTVPERPEVVEQPQESGRKSPDERKELLGRTLQGQIAAGYRVESQGDYQAVIIKGKPINNVLHLILTIITAGLWGLFVWLPLAIFGGEKRSMGHG